MKNPKVFEPCHGPSSLDDSVEDVEEEPTTSACSPSSTPAGTIQAPDKPKNPYHIQRKSDQKQRENQFGRKLKQ